MSQDRKGNPGPGDRWDEALSWHDTLRAAKHEQLTYGVGRRWQDWYADAENRRVFDAVVGLLADHGPYRTLRRPTKKELAADEYDGSVSIAEWHEARKLKDRPSNRGFTEGRLQWLSTRMAVVMGIVIFALASPWLLRLRPGGVGPRAPVIYRTDVGGFETVNLRDGSRIVLGGQTRLSVAYSAQRRLVSLIQGQAWFTVAHNPRRPFVVAAGGGTITAIGTAFLVTRDSDRVVVTVTEGVVQVAARIRMQPHPGTGTGFPLQPAMAPVSVSRGEELAFSDSGALSHVRSADTRAAAAWTHGQLVFDDQPLRYVVEAVDRYSSRHIVVSPDAGALRFSGIVIDSQIDDWLQSLEIIFPVTLETQGADVRIQMRDSQLNIGTPSEMPQR